MSRPGDGHVAHLTLVHQIDTGGWIVHTMQRGYRKAMVATAIGAVAVLAAACSTNSSSSTTTTAAAPTTTVGLPTTTIPTQSTNAAIATTVPASVKSKGTLGIALDATHRPPEGGRLRRLLHRR